MSKSFDTSSFLSPQQFYLSIILRVPRNTPDEIQARSSCAYRTFVLQLIISFVSLVIALVNYVSNESKYTSKIFMPYFATGHVYSRVDDDQHIYDGVMYTRKAFGKFASENKYSKCTYHTSIFNRTDTEYISSQGNKKSLYYAPYYTNATKTLDPICGVTLKELFYVMEDVCNVIGTNKSGLLGVSIILVIVMFVSGYVWFSSKTDDTSNYALGKTLNIVSSNTVPYDQRQEAYEKAIQVLNCRGGCIHITHAILSLYAIVYTTMFLTSIDDLRNFFGKTTSNDASCEPLKNYTIFIDKITDEFNIIRILNYIGCSIAIIALIGICQCKKTPDLVIYEDKDIILDDIYNNNSNNNMIEDGKPDYEIHYRNNDLLIKRN